MGQLALFDFNPFMTEEFYTGCPVEFSKKAIPELKKRPPLARFWMMSRSPGKAWVIGWDCQGDVPGLYLVSTDMLIVSQNAVEPPDLPGWAANGR
jgi:hypothetical protein